MNKVSCIQGLDTVQGPSKKETKKERKGKERKGKERKGKENKNERTKPIVSEVISIHV
jgi:hypothetical protein